MFDTVSNILILTWVVGNFGLMLYTYAAQTAYLRRLPPGITFKLRQYAWTAFSGAKRRELRRQIYWQQQADPELEQLRQEVRQRSRYLLLWMFGFPPLMFGVLALVVVTGHAR